MTSAKVLIIDDNRQNITVLEQLLMLENAKTVNISDTKNLEQNLSTLEDIDVVFLDLEMPHTNGYEALAMIRELPNFAETKVIAYSVHLAQSNNSLDAGFDGFLGKPIDAELFAEQFQNILLGKKIRYIP